MPKTLEKYLLLVVESTALPLSILIILMILTGYTIIEPTKMQQATLDIINYPIAVKLHTDFTVRLLLVSLTISHGYAGTILLGMKLIKRGYIRKIFNAIITIIYLYFVMLIVYLELM